ncbi:MAG TPA: hypothetical protein VFS07_03830 [Gemmatimonadales bacterium]|jgi:hypothetical protein|nr:hypothetical protein [Gemmatimonadales bacterium]
MRAVEPWVVAPLEAFLHESQAKLCLLMTTAGQVIAQHGFVRAVDVMGVAALGAGIVASTGELARTLSWPPFGMVVHQGPQQAHLLASFDTPRGRWIALVVFGTDTSLGLVQLFLEQLVQDLAAAAPAAPAPQPVLAADFERELNSSLRTLFGS